MTGPLDGVCIVDLTTNVMGPFASMLLADMGADVIKVESAVGDTMRRVGPARHPGMAAGFLHLNRNKRSIVLNLKSNHGLDALKTMLGSADVLVHSLRPAAMGRLGLSYADVKELNSRIIYCGAFGFGQDGPYADRPAYDDLMQAAVGVPLLQARRTGPPQYVALAVADRVVGMAAANAVTTALYRRSVTGTGQEVQVPMLETFAQFVLGDHLSGHTFDPPLGDWGYERMMNPERRPYATADGYIGINMYIDKHWRTFFRLTGHPEMAEDPRFANVDARAKNMALLYEFLAVQLATRTTDEWVSELTAADIPVMPLHTPESILRDEHMRAVGFFRDEDHPTEGRIRTMGVPQHWSEDAPQMRYPAPGLGEHTAAVLAEYGLEPEQPALPQQVADQVPDQVTEAAR
jgi:crotonobetainyl-CoA:carnitine CoA-transferase CaiB-like acyl-CoA transferase